MLRILLTTLLLLPISVFANINIVTSIKPIYSIVNSITHNVGKVGLLLDSQQSAHHFHLKPSQMSLIDNADLVIAIHPNMEEGINKILRNIPNEKVLYMVNEHDNSSANYHVWLDITKMQNFAKKLTAKLSNIYPDKRFIFEKNLNKLDINLSKLKYSVKSKLKKYNTKPLVTYSNALDYFIESNNLKSVAKVVNNHEQRLSAKRILDARKAIKNNNVKCLISTIEIAPKRTNILAEDFDINNTSVDIIGFNINKDSDLYTKLMLDITNKVEHCLQ